MRARHLGRLLGGALAVYLLFLPRPAEAHAAFVSSEPPPGAELASAPGAVVLRFTEPLNTGLSRATVTDPTGAQFDGAATTEHEIRVILRTNAPGIYLVEWTTVSTVDGHTLHGSFRFGVGVAPGAGGEAETGRLPNRWTWPSPRPGRWSSPAFSWPSASSSWRGSPAANPSCPGPEGACGCH
jgi:methionine-rich copper-binding protein CopC